MTNILATFSAHPSPNVLGLRNAVNQNAGDLSKFTQNTISTRLTRELRYF